jgi:glycosyltransferase involved in cell wall biosynthesis
MTASRTPSPPSAAAPLRILFTPPRYAPYIGGVEEHCRGYARELQRRGHNVTICCADEGMPLARVDGIPVRRCRTTLKIANTNITLGLPLHLAMASADIIHTFLPTPWSADWSAMIGKLRRKYVVVSYANDIVGQGAAATVASTYNRLLLPLTLRAADKILVSSAGYAESSPHLARYRWKVATMPPAVDTNRFIPNGDERWPATFFFLSLLDEYHRYKGLDVLLQAMALVVKEVPEARLLVGGSGPLQDEFAALSRRLNLESNVEFRGHLPEAELLTLYRRCTAFVLPSMSAEQEGFGIVAAEAMACGAPVIVSDIVGAAGQVVEVGAGITVPPGSVPALASALATMTTSNAAKFSTGGGRALVTSLYGTEVLATRLESLYRTVLGKKWRFALPFGGGNVGCLSGPADYAEKRKYNSGRTVLSE